MNHRGLFFLMGLIMVLDQKIDGFPNYTLVSTMFGGDVWITAFDESIGQFDEFEKVIEGSESDLGWTLEFYISPGCHP